MQVHSIFFRVLPCIMLYVAVMLRFAVILRFAVMPYFAVMLYPALRLHFVLITSSTIVSVVLSELGSSPR